MTGRIILSIFLTVLILSFPGCGRPQVQPDPDELVRLWDEPSTLDPHLARDADSAVILVEIFGGLVTLDTDLKIVPDLAESWTISPDGRTYTFSLQRDASFHDGKPVTADDVKWSLERPADPRTQSTTVDTYLGDIVGVRERLRGETSEVAGIKVIDDYTVAITIDAPKAYFISKLTYPTAFILDRDNVESGPQWFKTANGTGPFRLKEYVPGNRIILESNTSYHLGPPILKRIRFLLSGGQPMVMYENNEIYITGVELADLKRLLDPASPLKDELHR
ncbi:MAG: ABC transporter substrate-binding protein, partial [Dehalococcoidales bacterium]|nr:ABC transporter substrate-binding protein [Dehalococcoidales bacterium]